MATLPETTKPRKPAQAFYCTFHGLSGVLVMPNDVVWFLEPESGATTVITSPRDTPHLVVLGAVDVAMVAYLEDMARGGPAAIACSRDEGRA